MILSLYGFRLEYSWLISVLFSGYLKKKPFLFSIKLSLNHPTLASYIFVNKIEAFIFFSLLDSSKNWNLLLSILIFVAI